MPVGFGLFARGFFFKRCFIIAVGTGDERINFRAYGAGGALAFTKPSYEIRANHISH